MVAYCWQSGQIGIGRKAPEGTLPIITGTRKELEDTIQGTATLAYDNKTWLVPGIGLAETWADKLEALAKYVKWLNQPRKNIKAN